MKKILSLLLFTLAGIPSLSAQITVTCEGKQVNDGDVLTFYATEDDFGSITATPSETYLMDPTIYAATTPCGISVTVETSENARSGGLQWCGITTSCAEITGGTETRSTTIENFLGASLNLHGTFKAGQYKTYSASVTVVSDAGDKISFTENFVYREGGESGIADATAESLTAFDGRAISYHFPAAGVRSLAVYAPDGKLVKKSALTGARGSVSLGGLQPGVYVYSLSQGGKRIAGQKIVLR